MVDLLPSKHEVLGLTPNTERKKKKHCFTAEDTDSPQPRPWHSLVVSTFPASQFQYGGGRKKSGGGTEGRGEGEGE